MREGGCNAKIEIRIDRAFIKLNLNELLFNDL